MPYKSRRKDRLWHKQYMREKRKSVRKSGVVTPSTSLHPTDAVGNVIYKE